MNISQLLTGLPDADDTEIVDERSAAAKAREAQMIGLAKVRGTSFGRLFLSSGQVRRAAARRRASEIRKTTKSQMRTVLQNRQARATLQGQINLLADASKPTAQRYIAAQLAERYGSVTEAIEHAHNIELNVPQGAYAMVETLGASA